MTDIPTAHPADSTALSWLKSSYSGAEGNECVEVATIRTRVHVRDSKVVHGGTVTVSAEAFTTLLRAIGEGLPGAAAIHCGGVVHPADSSTSLV